MAEGSGPGASRTGEALDGGTLDKWEPRVEGSRASWTPAWPCRGEQVWGTRAVSTKAVAQATLGKAERAEPPLPCLPSRGSGWERDAQAGGGWVYL